MKKYCAQITKGDHTTTLGYSDDPRDAAMMYNRAALKIHGVVRHEMAPGLGVPVQ